MLPCCLCTVGSHSTACTAGAVPSVGLNTPTHPPTYPPIHPHARAHARTHTHTHTHTHATHTCAGIKRCATHTDTHTMNVTNRALVKASRVYLISPGAVSKQRHKGTRTHTHTHTHTHEPRQCTPSRYWDRTIPGPKICGNKIYNVLFGQDVVGVKGKGEGGVACPDGPCTSAHWTVSRLGEVTHATLSYDDSHTPISFMMSADVITLF